MSRDGEGDTSTVRDKKGFAVCQRCRSKKIKCDASAPGCKPCQKAKTSCTALDPANGEEIPRSIVRSLQAEIKRLRLQLNCIGQVEAAISLHSDGQDDQSDSESIIHEADYASQSSDGGQTSSQQDSSSLPPLCVDETFDPLTYANAVETRDYARPLKRRRREEYDSTVGQITEKWHVNPAGFLNPLSAQCDAIYELFFSKINPQVPVVDRQSFHHKLKLLRSKPDASIDKLSLQIMHLVLAVGYATQSEKNLKGAARHAQAHFEGAKLFQERQGKITKPLPRHSMFGLLPATDIDSQLEQLQCRLLVAIYSMMRPIPEGTLQAIAESFQLSIAIGLYNDEGRWTNRRVPKDIFSSAGSEPEQMRRATTDPSMDFSLQEEGRRLFWCCYCLDRYVAVNMGIPCSLSNEDINCELPWVAAQDGGKDKKRGWSRFAGTGHGSPHEPVMFNDDNCANEYLNVLEGATLSIQDDPSRWISIFYIKLRQLQSEIYDTFARLISDDVKTPKAIVEDAKMKSVEGKLEAWCRFAPLSREDLEDLSCSFNPDLLRLNYLQARQLLYSLHLRHTNATNLDNLEAVTLEIIVLVIALEEQGSMHLTWIMLHNLFVSATLHLFCAWQKVTTLGVEVYCNNANGRPSVKSMEIKELGDKLNKCFRSIGQRSRAGIRGKEALQSMFSTTEQLIQRYEQGRARKDVRRPWLDRLKKARLAEGVESEEEATHSETSSDTGNGSPGEKSTQSNMVEASLHRAVFATTPSDTASNIDTVGWGFDLDDFVALTDEFRHSMKESDAGAGLFDVVDHLRAS